VACRLRRRHGPSRLRHPDRDAADRRLHPGSSDLSISRNAKGRFKGTHFTTAQDGTASAAIVVDIAGALKRTRATGTLKAVVKIVDTATGADLTSCQGDQDKGLGLAPGQGFGNRRQRRGHGQL
jgi:hypothetical protein